MLGRTASVVRQHPGYPPSINVMRLPEGQREAAWMVSVQLAFLDNFIKDFEATAQLFAEMRARPPSTVQIAKPSEFSASDSIETRMRKMRAHNAKRRAEHVVLQDEAKHLRYRSRILMMAARDGAMTIFHIGKALEAINATLKLCPALAAHVDHTILRAACKRFARAFPHNEALRNAVAHVAELALDPHQFKKITGKMGGMSVNNINHVDEFTTTSFKGQRVSYRMNEKTAGLLTDMVRDLFSAFA